MSLEIKREQAKDKFGSGNFDESKSLYEDLFNATKDQWDGWGLARSYNKLKLFDKSENVCKEVYDAFPDFEYIKSPYAFALFMNKMKKKSPNFDSINIGRNFDLIYALENSQRFWTSPAFVELINALASDNKWELISNYYENIDINEISKESRVWNNKKLMSDREKSYLKIIKAYMKQEKWTNCEEVCNKGLLDFPNEFWFKRGKAIALGKKGDTETAIKHFSELLKIKQDWFIYRDLASVYESIDDKIQQRENLILGCLAASKTPDPGFKWEMFYELGLNLIDSEHAEFGKLHLQLAHAIREDEGWPTKENLANSMKKYQVENEFTKSPKQFIKELSSFWIDNKPNLFKDQEKIGGSIKVILPNNKSGFISSNSGDYYFNFKDINFKHSDVEIGLNVNFYTEKRFDQSKGVDSECAVEINKE